MNNRQPLNESQRLAYLNALGISLWTHKEQLPDVEEPEVKEPEVGEPESKKVQQLVHPGEDNSIAQEIVEAEAPAPPAVDYKIIQAMDLSALAGHVANCTACELHKTRKQTVFGVGHQKADWLIIGEAPGADEDRQGEPFVGRAGQLLTQMLRAIGLAREEVFIANILKCRPPNNRDPKVEEVAACHAYLGRQIELLEPKIILALGRIAAQSLLQTSTPIGKMRGRLYHLENYNIPVAVTYHPAYLLRSPKEKRKVWEDLKFARQQAMTAGQNG